MERAISLSAQPTRVLAQQSRHADDGLWGHSLGTDAVRHAARRVPSYLFIFVSLAGFVGRFVFSGLSELIGCGSRRARQAGPRVRIRLPPAESPVRNRLLSPKPPLRRR